MAWGDTYKNDVPLVRLDPSRMPARRAAATDLRTLRRTGPLARHDRRIEAGRLVTHSRWVRASSKVLRKKRRLADEKLPVTEVARRDQPR